MDRTTNLLRLSRCSSDLDRVGWVGGLSLRFERHAMGMAVGSEMMMQTNP